MGQDMPKRHYMADNFTRYWPGETVVQANHDWNGWPHRVQKGLDSGGRPQSVKEFLDYSVKLYHDELKKDPEGASLRFQLMRPDGSYREYNYGKNNGELEALKKDLQKMDIDLDARGTPEQTAPGKRAALSATMNV